jgi:hypothetical protein
MSYGQGQLYIGSTEAFAITRVPDEAIIAVAECGDIGAAIAL